MSRAMITESYLTGIANAIRAKLGVQNTYTPPQMAAAIESIPTGGITPTGTKQITQNGTHDVTQYASANVNVPNSYAAGDEGKVVSNGALVAQTSRSVTANGTYDTTTNDEVVVSVTPNLQSKTVTQNGTVTPDQGYDGLSSVVVNVSGGGVANPLYILDPDIMDRIAAVSPYAATTSINLIGTMVFAPFVEKINNPGSDYRSYWYAQKGTYNNVANVAFLGRGGNDRSGLIFTTKIPGGVYSELHVRFEITQGAYTGAAFAMALQSTLGFMSNDVYADPEYTLYQEMLASSLTNDNVKVIDISNITDDFYIAFGDYNGFVKIRGLWLEV